MPFQNALCMIDDDNIVHVATTPSTLTPTYEATSPQVSRKNSLANSRTVPTDEPLHNQRKISFQLENEVDPVTGKIDRQMKIDAVAGALTSVAEITTVKTVGEGANKLGQLFFKVR